MDRLFQTFVESLSRSPNASELQAAMEVIVAAFDLNRFAYLYSPRESPCEVKLISNYPSDWTSHYLANAYDRIDPVVGRARRAAEPFEWGSGSWLNDLRDQESQLMDEAAMFGIRCGFTLPVHDMSGRFAAMTFAVDQCHYRFLRCFEKHRDVLHLLAIAFHVEARRALAPNRSVDGVLLSPREFECLEWAARGKSAWDIGQIVGISPRTAAFHLENAKKKLNVRTNSQAVALLAASRRLNREG